MERYRDEGEGDDVSSVLRDRTQENLSREYFDEDVKRRISEADSRRRSGEGGKEGEGRCGKVFVEEEWLEEEEEGKGISDDWCVILTVRSRLTSHAV